MTAITPKTFGHPLLQAIREQLVVKRWYIHLLLWIVVLFMGFPLFYAALVSTQSNAQMFRLQLTPGDSFGINLQAVLDRNIARLMFNTFAVASMVTFGKAFLSIFSGMALVYFRFPGKSVVFGFILVALMVPGEVTSYRLVPPGGFGPGLGQYLDSARSASCSEPDRRFSLSTALCQHHTGTL